MPSASPFKRVAAELPTIEPRELRRIARGGGHRTAGLDNWSREVLKCWPDFARTHLAQLLALFERTGRWPKKLLHVISLP